MRHETPRHFEESRIITLFAGAVTAFISGYALFAYVSATIS